MDLIDVFEFDLKVLYIIGLLPFKYYKRKIRSRTIDNFSFVWSLIIIVISSMIIMGLQPLLEILLNIHTDSLQFEGAGQVIYNCRNLQASFALLTYVSLLFCSVLKKKSHIRLLQRLFAVDAELGKQFSVNINYAQEKKYFSSFLAIIISYVYVGPFILITYLCVTKNNLLNNRIMPIYCASFFSTPFHSFHYYVICQTLASRLKTVQELADTTLNKKQFHELVDINGRLRKCVDSLNEAHGVGQLFNLVNDCVVLTIHVFVLFYAVFSPKGHIFLHWCIGGIFWIVLFFFKILYISVVGERLKNQVSGTNKSLSENTYRRYKGKEMEILSGCPLDKLYNFHLRCTAADFIDIDNTLVTLVASTLITYLVILLQFQVDEN